MADGGSLEEEEFALLASLEYRVARMTSDVPDK